MMHSNISTTDKEYGHLTDHDAQQEIMDLGSSMANDELDYMELIRQLEISLNLLKKKLS